MLRLEARQRGFDRRERPVFVLPLAETVGIGAVRRIHRLLQKVGKVVLDVVKMRPPVRQATTPGRHLVLRLERPQPAAVLLQEPRGGRPKRVKLLKHSIDNARMTTDAAAVTANVRAT